MVWGEGLCFAHCWFPRTSSSVWHRFSSVQSLSCVRLFMTPWIAAHQASLSITNSQSLPKLMSIKSVMPSSHLILCHPLLLLPPSVPASGSFLMSQLFASGGQSIGVSASASVLPMNTQDWSRLGWTGWISLQSKGLSRVFDSQSLIRCWLFTDCQNHQGLNSGEKRVKSSVLCFPPAASQGQEESSAPGIKLPKEWLGLSLCSCLLWVSSSKPRREIFFYPGRPHSR